MKNPYEITLPPHKQTEAQKALWAGLLRLWQHKALCQIGIKELCQTAHVARSTFYLYYQNSNELAEEMEDYHIRALMELNREVTSTTGESYRFYQNTMEYLTEHKQLFYVWLVANPNEHFIAKWKKSIKAHLWERAKFEKDSPQQGLIMEMIAAAVVAGYTYWLQNPYEVDYAGMDQMVHQTLAFIK